MKCNTSGSKVHRSDSVAQFEIKILAQAIAAAFLLVTALPTLAADAGQLLQQIEKERAPTLPTPTAPEVTPAQQTPKPIEGVTVTVTEFKFIGNTVLSNGKLVAVVASYLNRPVTLAELQQAAGKVAEIYRKNGWVVRTFLPQQNIQNGSVSIQIIEAVLGNTTTEGMPSKRIKLGRAQAAVEAVQSKGKPLNTVKLDRALLVLDDLPGVVASGSLKSGANAGETDVLIKLADEPWLNGDAALDNYGSRSTGSTRLSGNFYLNSPALIGDQVVSNLMLSEGSDFLRLAYSVPVAYDGWRIGASTSAMNYKLISSDFSGKNGKGDSMTLGMDASYPFIRSRTENLYLGLNLDEKAFDNQLSAVTTSKYDITSAGIALNGNLFDELLGGGVNSTSLSLTQGNVALGTLDQNESANVGGNFSKVRYSASRQQFITDKITLYTALTGQQSSDHLDSSEKFYLGGANGVRAYPSSEGGGASGNMINLELRGRLPKGFLLTGFYDYGDIRNNDSSKSYSLKGAGLSLAWQADFGLLVKATWARRIGDNPNLTSAGNDQDGSFLNDRFWLVASIPFSTSGGKSAAEKTPLPDKTQPAPAKLSSEKSSPAPATVATAPVQPEPLAVVAAVDVHAPTIVPTVLSEAPLTKAPVPQQLERDKPLIVHGVNKSTDPFPAETKTMLDDIAKTLLANPQTRIEVSGHADKTKVSKAPYNVKLSLERASVVQQYLIAKGVPTSQITTAGYGFDKPIASNATPSGREQNRRVEIKLVD